MVKPCSRLSTTARTLRRNGGRRKEGFTRFSWSRDRKKSECLVPFMAWSLEHGFSICIRFGMAFETGDAHFAAVTSKPPSIDVWIINEILCKDRLWRFEYISLFFDTIARSSFVLSRRDTLARVQKPIVAKLFANDLVPSLEAILVSDSLKLSVYIQCILYNIYIYVLRIHIYVSVEKDVVLLVDTEWFICSCWTRSCVSGRFVSRGIEFSSTAFYAFGDVKCGGSMLHGDGT